MIEYTITLMINGSAQETRSHVRGEAKSEIIQEMISKYRDHLGQGAEFRFKVEEQKQGPVSAEEWVDKNILKLYESVEAWGEKAYKAGAKNERLYYAELIRSIERARHIEVQTNEPCYTPGLQVILQQLAKIKQHQEEKCKTST